MLVLLNILNVFFAFLLAVSVIYGIVYLIVALCHKICYAEPEARKNHCYAAVICARNEEAVIGELVQSLRRQNYPEDKLDIFVVADNCTDSTAEAAQLAGAVVIRRQNREEVGKGYALDFLFRRILGVKNQRGYAGYFIFDADNIVDANFVSEMNKTYDRGRYDAITCYRNSKNFSSNWISAGYSIWFLRQSRFLNFPRSILGLNCTVGGTGFFVSDRLIRENGGWPFHLLTEDIEFSANCAVRGCPIGYCDRAMVFDEQPTAFHQSWDQRLRWSKGFYQVNARYGFSLTREIFHGGRHGLSCWDVLMNLMPGLLALAGIFLAEGIIGTFFLTQPASATALTNTFCSSLFWGIGIGYYVIMFLCGLVTVLSEWRRIPTGPGEKLRYLPLFPIFMLTYLPIAVTALFRKVEWKPIHHSSAAQTAKLKRY